MRFAHVKFVLADELWRRSCGSLHENCHLETRRVSLLHSPNGRISRSLASISHARQRIFHARSAFHLGLARSDKPKFEPMHLILHIFPFIRIFSTQLKFFRIKFQKPLDKFFARVYNTPIKSNERKPVDRYDPPREPSVGARRRGHYG